MKQLFKLTGCLALAGLFASCQSVQQEANYQIIPMPQEIVTAQGSPFILKSSVKILYPEGNEKMQRNAKFLADYLKTATGKDFAIEAGTEGKNAIVLALGTENENPESYQMKVTGDGITITGPTKAPHLLVSGPIAYSMASSPCANHCLWLSVRILPCQP